MLVRAFLPPDKPKFWGGRIVYNLDILNIEPSDYDESWMTDNFTSKSMKKKQATKGRKRGNTKLRRSSESG